jgi:hypothetical protein
VKSKTSPKAKKLTKAQLEARLPPRNTPGLPPPLNVRPPVKPAKPAKDPLPDWLMTLPDHLDEFGTALHLERKNCVKLLTEAMEEYDDAIYDAVLDATPKDVLEAMKKGREGITSQADAILAIACSCAEDHAPNLTQETILERGIADDPGSLGEGIGCALSAGCALEQSMLCRALVHNLSKDAREALLNALLP